MLIELAIIVLVLFTEICIFSSGVCHENLKSACWAVEPFFH